MKTLPPRERAKVARFVYANHVPNAATRKVLAGAEPGRGLVRSKNLDDMMASLKSSCRGRRRLVTRPTSSRPPRALPELTSCVFRVFDFAR